jgi:hypothetical protein
MSIFCSNTAILNQFRVTVKCQAKEMIICVKKEVLLWLNVYIQSDFDLLWLFLYATSCVLSLSVFGKGTPIEYGKKTRSSKD